VSAIASEAGNSWRNIEYRIERRCKRLTILLGKPGSLETSGMEGQDGNNARERPRSAAPYNLA